MRSFLVTLIQVIIVTLIHHYILKDMPAAMSIACMALYQANRGIHEKATTSN